LKVFDVLIAWYHLQRTYGLLQLQCHFLGLLHTSSIQIGICIVKLSILNFYGIVVGKNHGGITLDNASNNNKFIEVYDKNEF